MVKVLEGKLCQEQLKSLGASSLEETERRPHCSQNSLMRGSGGAGIGLISVVVNGRTQGNDLQLCEGSLGWILRRGFSSGR